MSTVQIRDLPAAASLDGSELVELQKAAGGAGSSEQAPIGAITPPGYIDGLKMVWVSGTALTVTSGAAYIQSLGRVLRVPSDIAKTALTLSASTWYHVYLFFNGAAADFELSTTAPAVPYNGTARAKTGDTSRRYVGSVLTDASGNICNFLQVGHSVKWRMVPPRVLSNGLATAATTVSFAGAVPITSRLAMVRLINTATAGRVKTSTSDASADLVTLEVAAGPSRDAYIDHPLDASQAMTYRFDAAPTGGGAYIDVYGYQFER